MIVSEFLAGEHKLGSLASLTVTTQHLHASTSAVLWTTVTLDTVTPKWNVMLQKVLEVEGMYRPSEAELEALRTAKDTFEKSKDTPGALPYNRCHVK
jgi:hypothetical protein